MKDSRLERSGVDKVKWSPSKTASPSKKWVKGS